VMSTNKAGRNNGAHGQRIRAVPTPNEIDAVIADLMATEAVDVTSEAVDVTSIEILNDFWFAKAIDPRGETRAYGLGHTPAEACVKAWITFWDAEDDFDTVPRVVPEGWRFEVYPPGEGLVPDPQGYC